MESENTEFAPQDTGPEPGEVLDGRFEIIAQVGRGGVGSVFSARRLKLELPLAIKVLHLDSAQNEELRLRFEREAHAMAALSHPNIVSVTDFGVWKGRPYLVMEYLQGQTLYELMQEGPVPIETFVHIATHLLRGVAHAHARGLVHRDLKPANVFLQQTPDQPLHVKVLDFGFAKFIDERGPGNERDLTKAGVVFGTPAYMSPEQAVGEAMDARTDVYALGVILYEMLTGTRPFKGDYPELTRQKLTEAVPSMKERAPDLRMKPALEQLVMGCLARDRTQRPADAVALLEAFLALPSPPATRGDGAPGRLSRVSDVAVRVAGRGARVAGVGLGKLLAALGRASVRLLMAMGRLSRRALLALVARFGWLRVLAGAVVIGLAVAVTVMVRGGGGAVEGAAEGAASAAAGESGAASTDTGTGTSTSTSTSTNTKTGAGTGTGAGTDTDTAAGADTVAGAVPGVRVPAANPWSRKALPGALEKIRGRILRGQDVSENDIKLLRTQLREVRDDPRPALLIAYVYAHRNWHDDAITWYRTAYSIDSASRGDPRMQRELIELVQTSAREAASAALLELYGAEAVPGVERHLQRARLTEAERQVLLALRDRLRARH